MTHMGWYRRVKQAELQREAIDWKEIRNGLLMGGGLATIPGAIMIWMAMTGSTQQEAESYVGQDENRARQIIESAPPDIRQQVLSSPDDPRPEPRAVAPQPNDQLEGNSPSSARNNPFAHFIEQWEGREAKSYQDTPNNKSVGVGFNLSRSDARQMLDSVGADYDAVVAGSQMLDDGQIDTLLAHTVQESEQDARVIFPSFDQHPLSVQQILVDLTYNMGRPTLISQFPRFRHAIGTGDYGGAAQELINSKWYGQVGRRSKHHVGVLQNLAN